MKYKNLNIMTALSVMFLMGILFTTCVFAQETREEWVKKYDGGDNDTATAIAMDSSRNVYVIGKSYNLLSWVDDYIITKYDNDGREQWVRKFSSGIFGAVPAGIVIDSSDNVYVAGVSYDSGQYDFDFVLIKYNTHGQEEWIRRYDSGYGESPAAIAIDSLDNIYVTGTTHLWQGEWGLSPGFVTVKYDKGGDLKWFRHYHSYSDSAVGIAVDSLNNIYVTGTGVYWYGSNYWTDYSWDYVTVKYSSEGNEEWVRKKKEGYTPVAIKTDSSNNIYLTGMNDSYSNIITIKYSDDGTEIWVKEHSSGSRVTGLALDSSGNPYVTGYSSDTSHNICCTPYYDYVTIKYDTNNGDELWVKRYDYMNDMASAITVDSYGNVYVTGTSGFPYYGLYYDYVTIKYDTYGNELWTKKFDSCYNDYPAVTAVDAIGDIYVTGISYNSAWTTDIATVKYSQVSTNAPTAPSDLLASTISWNKISLSWSDNSTNEDGFKIMRASASDGPFTVIASMSANSTSYQDAGLSPETTYYYKLMAFNANGDSDYANVAGSTGCGASHAASATTLSAPPDTEGPGITIYEPQQTIWPPNSKMVNVTISGIITDMSDIASASYAVQDEYDLLEPSGSITLAEDGSYNFTISLEASRLGSDADGRVYTVYITAMDAVGNTSTTSPLIIVPHDQGGI